jgi:4'-phosphopantetheinyl transferase
LDDGVPPLPRLPSLRGPLSPAAAWSSDASQLDLWRVRLRAPKPAELAILSGDERDRAGRQHARAGGSFAAARYALRCVLGRYVSRAPQSLVFRYGAHGRPALEGAAGLDFNLSHSGDFAVIAVAERARAGVDLQKLDRARDHSRIASRFFASAERDALAELEGESRVQAFYRTWACKEAYLKALGTSIAVLPPTAFCFDFTAEQVRLVRSAWAESSEDWQFGLFDAPDEYAGALCWSGELDGFRTFDFEPERSLDPLAAS